MNDNVVGVEHAGAAFYRCDLHIHSYGASHDVKAEDASMTPAAIVARAADEGLSLISIADHNEIYNVRPALLAAADSTVVVIPGVELSTPQGHLLVYFRQVEDLEKFHASFQIRLKNQI